MLGEFTGRPAGREEDGQRRKRANAVTHVVSGRRYRTLRVMIDRGRMESWSGHTSSEEL